MLGEHIAPPPQLIWRGTRGGITGGGGPNISRGGVKVYRARGQSPIFGPLLELVPPSPVPVPPPVTLYKKLKSKKKEGLQFAKYDPLTNLILNNCFQCFKLKMLFVLFSASLSVRPGALPPPPLPPPLALSQISYVGGGARAPRSYATGHPVGEPGAPSRCYASDGDESLSGIYVHALI